MKRSNVHQQRSGFGASRRARELAERERVILGAAERVIGRHGFHDAGICEIAREAEYAIGTLYGLFPSKEALYERLVEIRAEELAVAMRTALAVAGSIRDRLQAAFGAKLEFFACHRSFLRIYASASSMASSSWATPAGASRARAENLSALAAAIDSAQRSGELDHDASAADLALAFQSLSTSFLVAAVPEAGDIDRDRARDAMQRVFFERVLGEPRAEPARPARRGARAAPKRATHGGGASRRGLP